MIDETKTTTPAGKLHYYLVAGSVVVNHEDNPQALPANGILQTDMPQIGEYQLGKAQVALQVSLFRKLGTTIQVVDVIIHNLVYLGWFTDAEFHAKPEGVELQERAKPSADIIDFTSAVNEGG